MQRQLNKDVSVSVFSFLSIQDIPAVKQINKNINYLASLPLLWKRLIQRDFAMADLHEVKRFEPEYKNLLAQAKQEEKRILNYLKPLRQTLAILNHLSNKSKTHANMVFATQSSKLYRDLIQHNNISLKTITKLQNDYPKIKINENELSSSIETIMQFAKQPAALQEKPNLELVKSLVMTDSIILLRIFLNNLTMGKTKKQQFLSMLLHTACSCLSIQSARLLLTLDVKVNELFSQPAGGIFSMTNCLFATVVGLGCKYQKLGISEQRVNITREWIQMLLKNGSDPDAEVHVLDPDTDTLEFSTVRKHFRKVSEGLENEYLIMLAQLIVTAPKKQKGIKSMDEVRIAHPNKRF